MLSDIAFAQASAEFATPSASVKPAPRINHDDHDENFAPDNEDDFDLIGGAESEIIGLDATTAFAHEDGREDVREDGQAGIKPDDETTRWSEHNDAAGDLVVAADSELFGDEESGWADTGEAVPQGWEAEAEELVDENEPALRDAGEEGIETDGDQGDALGELPALDADEKSLTQAEDPSLSLATLSDFTAEGRPEETWEEIAPGVIWQQRDGARLREVEASSQAGAVSDGAEGASECLARLGSVTITSASPSEDALRYRIGGVTERALPAVVQPPLVLTDEPPDVVLYSLKVFREQLFVLRSVLSVTGPQCHVVAAVQMLDERARCALKAVSADGLTVIALSVGARHYEVTLDHESDFEQ